jgi:hypothetical protein
MSMAENSKPPMVAVGATGLKQYGGYIQEEYLHELSGDRWWRVVAEMSTADPTITGILFAIQMLIRQVTFTVTPFSEEQQDKDDAAFVESCVHDMRESWALTLSEILSFLPWGYAPLEVVYKVRGGEVYRKDGSVDMLRSSQHDDGKVGWACWSIRSQDTIVTWEFDEDGAAVAFTQWPPPNYLPLRVPLAKCLHFRTMSRKSNPEGVSLLRGVYRPWYFMKRLQNLEGIGIERDLVGIPQIDVPAEMLDPDAPAAVKAALSYYKEMGQNIRNDEQACIIMPRVYDDSGHEMYGFKLVSAAGTRQFDIGASVERYKTDIATAVMADFMRLGHEGVGSYSLASSKTSLFATALGAWLDSICSVIQGRIPELLRFNGMDVKREPKLTHGDVEKIDLGQLGEFLTALTGAQAGGLFNGPAGPRIQRYLLEQAGMPTPTEAEAQQAADEEQQRNEQEAQDKAAQLAMLNTPPPTPPNAPPAEPAKAAEGDPLDSLIDSVLDEAFALAGEAE